jgi:hypothetical protein
VTCVKPLYLYSLSEFDNSVIIRITITLNTIKSGKIRNRDYAVCYSGGETAE